MLFWRLVKHFWSDLIESHAAPDTCNQIINKNVKKSHFLTSKAVITLYLAGKFSNPAQSSHNNVTGISSAASYDTSFAFLLMQKSNTCKTNQTNKKREQVWFSRGTLGHLGIGLVSSQHTRLWISFLIIYIKLLNLIFCICLVLKAANRGNRKKKKNWNLYFLKKLSQKDQK